MSHFDEVAPDERWYLKDTEDDGLFVKLDDKRFKTASGLLSEEVQKIEPYKKDRKEDCVLICLKVPKANNEKRVIKFSVKNYDDEKSSIDGCNSQMTSKEFAVASRKVLKGPAAASTPKRQSPEQANSPVSPALNHSTKRKSGGAEEVVDLSSPSKKLRPTGVDQEIDAHFLGNFTLDVESLSDSCPKMWLDRELNQAQVNDLVDKLTKTPTLAKSQQPWLGIVDLPYEKIQSKKTVKGARITVIGGRHRHAAYKKVSQVSEVHAMDLKKVQILLYDNTLSDEEIRRLASLHNTMNEGSTSTDFLTRVQACREWLYHLANKDICKDETPKSTPEWRKDCQTMYTKPTKDANSIEPVLQAALLSREVYNEFKNVGELFKAGDLKDQKKKKKKGSSQGQITQNQLGMPLQGLADETKLSLLKDVTSKRISLKEMRDKSDRIKKKQLVVNAFLRHTGEDNWESLKERFPLHTTEEKLAQFTKSSISRRKTPEEVISFFERAIEWEKNGESPLNLHEERDGIYIYKADNQYGILMEGSIEDIPLEKLQRVMKTSFKGYSLVIASISDEVTKVDLSVFLANIHAVNVDNLKNYTVAIFTSHKQVEMVTQTLTGKFGVCQTAFWVDTKAKKLQGNQMMVSSVEPIVFGHWSKNKGDMICHFEEEDDASNAFCFESEASTEKLPQKLFEHIVKHFSFESQWVLDVTGSRDSGLVATLKQSRNCVSLMSNNELRATASLATPLISSVPHENDKEPDTESENEEIEPQESAE